MADPDDLPISLKTIPEIQDIWLDCIGEYLTVNDWRAVVCVNRWLKATLDSDCQMFQFVAAQTAQEMALRGLQNCVVALHLSRSAKSEGSFLQFWEWITSKPTQINPFEFRFPTLRRLRITETEGSWRRHWNLTEMQQFCCGLQCLGSRLEQFEWSSLRWSEQDPADNIQQLHHVFQTLSGMPQLKRVKFTLSNWKFDSPVPLPEAEGGGFVEFHMIPLNLNVPQWTHFSFTFGFACNLPIYSFTDERNHSGRWGQSAELSANPWRCTFGMRFLTWIQKMGPTLQSLSLIDFTSSNTVSDDSFFVQNVVIPSLPHLHTMDIQLAAGKTGSKNATSSQNYLSAYPAVSHVQFRSKNTHQVVNMEHVRCDVLQTFRLNNLTIADSVQFGLCARLTRFTLTDCTIKGNFCFFKSILRQIPHLQYLEMENVVNHTDTPWCSWADFIHTVRPLVQLKLWLIQFEKKTDGLMLSVCPAALSRLQTLEIGGCPNTSPAKEMLCNLFDCFQHCAQLSSLDLTLINLRGATSDLMSKLSYLRQLQNLSLRYCALGPSHIPMLVSALQDLQLLKTINLLDKSSEASTLLFVHGKPILESKRNGKFPSLTCVLFNLYKNEHDDEEYDDDASDDDVDNIADFGMTFKPTSHNPRNLLKLL